MVIIQTDGWDRELYIAPSSDQYEPFYLMYKSHNSVFEHTEFWVFGNFWFFVIRFVFS